MFRAIRHNSVEKRRNAVKIYVTGIIGIHCISYSVAVKIVALNKTPGIFIKLNTFQEIHFERID